MYVPLLEVNMEHNRNVLAVLDDLREADHETLAQVLRVIAGAFGERKYPNKRMNALASAAARLTTEAAVKVEQLSKE
jgi:hypothetical protein